MELASRHQYEIGQQINKRRSACGTQVRLEHDRGSVFLIDLVHAVFQSHFPCGLCVELDILCMRCVLEMIIKFFPAPGACIILLLANDHFEFPTVSTIFLVAKVHPRF